MYGDYEGRRYVITPVMVPKRYMYLRVQVIAGVLLCKVRHDSGAPDLASRLGWGVFDNHLDIYLSTYILPGKPGREVGNIPT